MYTKLMKNTIVLFLVVATITSLSTRMAHAATSYFLHIDVSTDTYAPYHYTQYAKTLPIEGSVITFAANLFQVTETTIKKQKVSQYQILEPSLYQYTWYINERLLQEGNGDSVFKYTIPRGVRLGGISMAVEVRNKDNALVVQKKIIVPTKNNPEIYLYPFINDKLIPVSTDTITGVRSQTMKIVALPYFFNVFDPLQLSFLWYEGRKKLPTESYQNGLFEITLPPYPAQDNFKSVVYNTYFDLELAQKNFKVISK